MVYNERQTDGALSTTVKDGGGKESRTDKEYTPLHQPRDFNTHLSAHMVCVVGVLH